MSPVDPQILPILEELRRMPRIHETPIDELRGNRRQPMTLPIIPIQMAEDRYIPGPGGNIPIRLYRPKTGQIPIIIFFHGGGFVFGGLDGYYDALCRRLSVRTGCAVVAVDYRLAPEHKFPAASDDARAVHLWLAERGAEWDLDPGRIALFGISAGGNLAAATALRSRNEVGPTLKGVVLFYPVLDLYDPARESYETFADDYYLTREDMIWFWEHYLGKDGDGENPYAAPLRAPTVDHFAPTLIFAAGCDPLRDEAVAMHRRLCDAGTDASLTMCDGMIHGFLAIPLPRTDTFVNEATDWLSRRLGVA